MTADNHKDQGVAHSLTQSHKRHYKYVDNLSGRSQRSRSRRRTSASACLLRLWVRIPPEAWMSRLLWVLCCQVEVSTASWSLVQRSSTDCGVSLCMILKSRERGGPGPLMGCSAKKKSFRRGNVRLYGLAAPVYLHYCIVLLHLYTHITVLSCCTCIPTLLYCLAAPVYPHYCIRNSERVMTCFPIIIIIIIIIIMITTTTTIFIIIITITYYYLLLFRPFLGNHQGESKYYTLLNHSVYYH